MGDFIAILLDRAYGDRISLSPKGGGGKVPISLILVKVQSHGELGGGGSSNIVNSGEGSI